MCSGFHFPFPLSSHTSTPCPNLGNFSTTMLQGITPSFCSCREISCHFQSVTSSSGLEIQIISCCPPTGHRTQKYKNTCSLYPTSSMERPDLSPSLVKLNIICQCLYIQLGLSHHNVVGLFISLLCSITWQKQKKPPH